MSDFEAFPKKKLVAFRNDQYMLMEKAKAVSGRNLSEIIREGAVSLARRIVADHKKNEGL